jgi:Ca2+-transporting ATPase
MVYAARTPPWPGQAIVVAAGMQTEFGRIAYRRTVDASRTPAGKSRSAGKRLPRRTCHRRADRPSVSTGARFIDMLVFGIALAVAVVPEASG